jgi:hypothetical protein
MRNCLYGRDALHAVTPGIVYHYACNIDVLGPVHDIVQTCNMYCSHCDAEGFAPRVFICFWLWIREDLHCQEFPPKIVKYYTNIHVHNIVECDIITFYLCMWSWKPPETVSEVVNFKTFSRGACHQTPLVYSATQEFPPSTKKSCIIPCLSKLIFTIK